MLFPIERIILEGPDLSGKTTLYNKIHKLSNYRWNIQDRSTVSMVLNAQMFNRDTYFQIENCKKELANSNVVQIICLPSWDVISQRYSERGDEIHDFMSLRDVYQRFENIADELKNRTNVLIINTEDTDFAAKTIVRLLLEREYYTLDNISKIVMQNVSSTNENEIRGLNFHIMDDGTFSNCDESVLKYEKEKDYYAKIIREFEDKINKELEGENEYSRIEDAASRRFIYTDDSCISCVHFLIRDNVGYFDCFLRSSNVGTTLKYDLNFLYILCKRVCKKLNFNSNVIANITLNSAHILSNV
jgi:hypothetical protein